MRHEYIEENNQINQINIYFSKITKILKIYWNIRSTYDLNWTSFELRHIKCLLHVHWYFRHIRMHQVLIRDAPGFSITVRLLDNVWTWEGNHLISGQTFWHGGDRRGLPLFLATTVFVYSNRPNISKRTRYRFTDVGTRHTEALISAARLKTWLFSRDERQRERIIQHSVKSWVHSGLRRRLTGWSMARARRSDSFRSGAVRNMDPA